MSRIEIIKKLLELYKQLLEIMLKQPKPLPLYQPQDKSQKIYDIAKSCIGKKMAPIYKDSGCVEAVDNNVRIATGKGFGENASTYRLFSILKYNGRYKRVDFPEPGDIVISPTGYGNGKISGHVGIVSDGGKIMSNNSDSLLFDEHYTIETWEARYKGVGGFPVYYYKVLA